MTITRPIQKRKPSWSFLHDIEEGQILENEID
jgi:hypothetical protein